MLADVSNFKPAELLQSRRDLLSLRKSLFHEREILIKICRKDCPFIPDKGNLPLSRHLRPSHKILRVDRVLSGYSHQSHGDVPVDAEQPDDQSRQPDKQRSQATDFHHHYLYAAHASGWNRRDVRVVYDDRTCTTGGLPIRLSCSPWE